MLTLFFVCCSSNFPNYGNTLLVLISFENSLRRELENSIPATFSEFLHM